MPTDATGTPTSLGIRKYNTSVDAPSGLGFNGAMDDIDALLLARVSKPGGIASGEVPVWNGTTWVRSSTLPVGSSSLGTGGDGSGTHALFDDGTFKAITSGAAFKVTGTFDDVNLSTEQSLIAGAVASGSTGWQIPANKLGASGAVRFVMGGDYFNNTGGAQNITMKAKFGGTTLFGNLNAPGVVARVPFFIVGVIANIGATNSQVLTAYFPVFTVAPGTGSIAGTLSVMSNTVVAAGTSAIDTTAAQFFDITAQHGAANASLSIRRHFAMAEYL